MSYFGCTHERKVLIPVAKEGLCGVVGNWCKLRETGLWLTDTVDFFGLKNPELAICYDCKTVVSTFVLESQHPYLGNDPSSKKH